MSILVVKSSGIADLKYIEKGIDDCYLADHSITLRAKSLKNNRTIFFYIEFPHLTRRYSHVAIGKETRTANLKTRCWCLLPSLVG